MPQLKDRILVWRLDDDHPTKKALIEFIEKYQGAIQTALRPYGVNLYNMNKGIFNGYKQESWKYVLRLLWLYDLGGISKEEATPLLKDVFKKDYEKSYAQILNNPKTKGLIKFVGKKKTNLSKEQNLNGLVSDLLRFKNLYRLQAVKSIKS